MTEAYAHAKPAVPEARRAKVAPLLAAGMSVREISAETNIPVGAVHRAKRQIEKMVAQQAGQKAATISLELPLSYLVKQDINGVRQDVRRLTVSVFRHVESAIGRRLLGRGDRAEAWTVVSALFAGMFDDHTIEWLNKRGYLTWDQRGQGEAIIAAINALIGRQR
jgi:hypothetical protein